jgi:hypothetical protein
LTYWWKCWRIGNNSPQSVTSSGTRGVTHGSKQDGVESAQTIESVGGHHGAVSQVVLAPPLELDEFEYQSLVELGDALEDTARFDRYLGADAVAGQQCDSQMLLGATS